MELLEVVDEQTSKVTDPRFGREHHPIISQTKVSKQPALVIASTNDSSNSFMNQRNKDDNTSAVEHKSVP